MKYRFKSLACWIGFHQWVADRCIHCGLIMWKKILKNRKWVADRCIHCGKLR